MSIAGMRGTDDWGADERPKNFRESILWRDPNGQAPLVALSAKMKSESTDDPEFSWWEEENNTKRLQVDAISTTGATTLSFDGTTNNALELVAGDVLLVEQAVDTGFTNEFVRVTADPTATTAVTISRGQLGSTAGDINTNTWLTKVGTSFEEGSSAPKATTRNPTKYTSYCQIFKTAYDITETAKATRARTGDPLKNDKKRRMFDHSIDLEWAALFGRPFEDLTGTKPRRYTGGLMYWLSQEFAAGSTHCIVIWTAGTTEDTILDNMHRVFDYKAGGAGDERIILAGNGWLNQLNQVAATSSSTRINYDGVVKTFGMALQRWVTPQGSFFVRTHPLMNTHNLYRNGAFVVNPAGVRYRPLVGRATKPQDHIELPDEDRHKGQWIGEEGYEFNHLKTMQYVDWTGI